MWQIGLIGLALLGCNRSDEGKQEKNASGQCAVCPQGGIALPTGAGGAFGIASPASISDNCEQTQCK
jgi:hypothetical protein